MKLPCFWNPDKNSWFFGYWCSGPESLPRDGLLCYYNLEGKSQSIREKYLVEERKDPITALINWLKRGQKDFT